MISDTELSSVFPNTPQPENPADIRTLTIAFLDIVGSTRHASEQDLEEYDAFLEQAFDLIQATVSAYGGQMLERWGDGALAVFGMVQDAEDAAAAAIKACLTICNHAPDQCGADIRAGLHSGAVVCRTGETPALPKRITGLDVTIAARLQEQALPGSVLISADTRDFTNRVALLTGTPAMPFTPKGMSDPMTPLIVTALDMTAGVGGEFQTCLGREAVLKSVAKSNQAVLFFTGPAGIGKTTFLNAAVKTLRLRRVLQLNARANLCRTSLFPCRELLLSLFGTHIPLDNDTLAVGLSQSGLRLRNQDMPILKHILRLEGSGKITQHFAAPVLRARRIAVTADLIGQLMRSQPLAVIFDDIDLADQDSVAVFQNLVAERNMGQSRLFLSSRTRDVAVQLGLLPEQVIPLDNLDQVATQQVIQRVRRDLKPAAVEKITQMSEGNPLFAEMLALSAAAQSEDPDPKLPTSLGATMEARLRSFGKAAQLIRAAAVLGRQFPAAHLGAFVSTEQIQSHMPNLIANRVFHETSEGYAFDHLMLRDTAYKMIPKSQVKHLHAIAARDIPGLDPDYAETFPEIFAEHAIRSEQAELIIPRCMTAGIAQLSGAHFDQALHFLSAGHTATAVPDLATGLRELSIPITALLASAEVQTLGFAHPDVKQRYSDLSALVKQSGANSWQEMSALYGLFAHRMISGRVRACGALLDEMDRVAHPEKDDQQLLRSVNHAAYALYRRDLPKCARYINDVTELYKTAQHGRIFLEIGADPFISVQTARTYLLAIQGDHDAALSVAEQAECHAKSIGAHLQIPWIRIFAGQCLFLNGAPDTASDLLERGVCLAEKQGGVFWILTGKMWKQIRALERDPDYDTIADLSKTIDQLTGIGAKLSLPYAQSRIACAYRKNGQLDDAGKWALSAMHGITRTGERLWAPYILEEFAKYRASVPDKYQTHAAKLQNSIYTAATAHQY